MAGFLVSCSTSLKPLHFIHGQPTTNAVLVNTSIPSIKFMDGKPIAPQKMTAIPSKGAQQLTKPIVPASVSTVQQTVTPAPIVIIQHSGSELLVYYTIVAAIALWIYKNFIKFPAKSLKKSLLPKDEAATTLPPTVPPSPESPKPPAVPPQ